MENNNLTKEEYNEVPLYYCKRCLSLHILRMDEIGGIDYCVKCGGTEIGVSLLPDWEVLYEDKYGKKLIKTKTKLDYGRW